MDIDQERFPDAGALLAPSRLLYVANVSKN